MCIRDSDHRDHGGRRAAHRRAARRRDRGGVPDGPADPGACLLYTSDAADERSSVDLGGRRIIKKKKTVEMEDGGVRSYTNNETHRVNQYIIQE